MTSLTYCDVHQYYCSDLLLDFNKTQRSALVRKLKIGEQIPGIPVHDQCKKAS